MFLQLQSGFEAARDPLLDFLRISVLESESVEVAGEIGRDKMANKRAGIRDLHTVRLRSGHREILNRDVFDNSKSTSQLSFFYDSKSNVHLTFYFLAGDHSVHLAKASINRLHVLQTAASSKTGSALVSPRFLSASTPDAEEPGMHLPLSISIVHVSIPEKELQMLVEQVLGNSLISNPRFRIGLSKAIPYPVRYIHQIPDTKKTPTEASTLFQVSSKPFSRTSWYHNCHQKIHAKQQLLQRRK